MIGVFDSGMGGRKVLETIRMYFPSYDFLYLGDTKNLPYGTKDPQFLKSRTFECLERMFDQGCCMVILACNTASAYAIRSWQEQFPDRKVLSVTVPGVEKIIAEGYKRPVIFATQATIQSGIYLKVLERICPSYQIQAVPLIGKGLVERIERGIGTYELVQNLFGTIRNQEYDAVVLGCTHYSLIAHEIQEIVGKWIPIVDPGLESAIQLKNYLQNHPEISITQGSTCQLYVTGLGTDTLAHVNF